MYFTASKAAAGIAALAVAVAASPVAVSPRVGTDADVPVARDLVNHARSGIYPRASVDFSLADSWNNQVLYDGSVGGAATVKLTCETCNTAGTVTASLSDPDIDDPIVQLSFSGVSAHMDLDLSASATASYTVNLITTESPLGISVAGLSVGLLFYLDLVFSVDAEIDMSGGFELSIPDGSYVEAKILDGTITDTAFDNIQTTSLPVTVNSGSAKFQADLRLRAQLGADIEIPDVGGGGAVLGVFANLIEFIAELEPASGCAIEALEWFDLNVGASASAGFNAGWTSIAVVPATSTTFYISPTTWTQCIGGAPSSSAASNATQAVIGERAMAKPVQTEYTIKACAERVVNCPATLEHKIVATQVVDAAALPTSSKKVGAVVVSHIENITLQKVDPIVNSFTPAGRVHAGRVFKPQGR